MNEDPIGNPIHVCVSVVAAGDFDDNVADGQFKNVEDGAQSSTNDQQYADDFRLTVPVSVAVIFQL